MSGDMYIDDSIFEKELDIALSRIKNTLLQKRECYGSGNMKKFGQIGTLIRLSDKVERLINMTQKNICCTEIDEDSWLDAAGYCVLGMMQQRV